MRAVRPPLASVVSIPDEISAYYCWWVNCVAAAGVTKRRRHSLHAAPRTEALSCNIFSASSALNRRYNGRWTAERWHVRFA